MSQNKSAIIGSIVERKPSSSPKPPVAGTSRYGFPSAQYRSQSAFARNRENARKSGSSRPNDAPPVLQSGNAHLKPNNLSNADDWRAQVSRENEAKVASMTEQEREEERQEILRKFGANIGDVLKRSKDARERQGQTVKEGQVFTSYTSANTKPLQLEPSLDEVPLMRMDTPVRRNSFDRARSPPSALSTSSTRPPSRADRKLRFAALNPEDVHVYESAPPSPHRKVLALPPPTDDGSAISLGQWNGKMVPSDPAGQNIQTPSGIEASVPTSLGLSDEPEEGTSEYIRRRFFPDAPTNDPNLAWMESRSSDSAHETTSSLRFDLQGNPIPPQTSSQLPTHLGLHHHAEGLHAGYTLDDIFMVSRSTVPAQRATMLGILARIAFKIPRANHGDDGLTDEVIGKEDKLRKRIIAAGVEAMSERGGVGTRAVEVIWQCVVNWNEELTTELEGIELDESSDSILTSLPLEFMLPQIATILAQGDAAPETMEQLLSILYRLAQQSNDVATTIIATPKLIPQVVQTFILTPIPLVEESSPPDPSAIEFLIELALSSRENAKYLEEFADALLRFVSLPPSSSLFPPELFTNLLTSTLRFYTVLASYGLYSHIAATAMTHFSRLGQYILSSLCTSRKLMASWGRLLEAWMVCAIDPHKTTPDHDLLWSQIVGWEWSTDLTELQTLLDVDEKDWKVWSAIWRAQAAWLEGCKMNAVKGGEAERSKFLEVSKGGLESGKERDVVQGVISAMQGALSNTNPSVRQKRILAEQADVLVSMIRLWLSCLAPHTRGPPESPPFVLPFPQISELCASVLNHALWTSLSESDSYGYISCRHLSSLLAWYLQLSRRLPGISEDLWMAQAFSILNRLMPGDEGYALQVMRELVGMLGPEWAAPRGLQVPTVIWEKRLTIVKPFLEHALKPKPGVYIGPLDVSTNSIMLASTQRLPSPSTRRTFGLPVLRDWTLTPLDHLLRSGDSAVFKALPLDWDASEIEVARGSLFFTGVARDVLRKFSLQKFVITREEAIFGCMKVFMLEHEQPQGNSVDEVFRDQVVGRLMEDLLKPYTFGASEDSHHEMNDDIEKVAVRFLGPSVPFYQYYTDFIALYDAISFSHPTFARLLLPPTSTLYPLDYRKLLWSDYKHILRTIRIPFDQVISADLREYLYPIETDPQLIGSYLGALLTGSLQEFLRLVAVHHVASNIWPDLQRCELQEDRASRLLKAVVDQGNNEVVREVVLYRQSKDRPFVAPPLCFADMDKTIKSRRMDVISRWGGQKLFDRLQGLFFGV